MRKFSKRISNSTRRVLALLFLVFAMTAAAQAATVRGQLVRGNGYGGVYAVGYVKVTLWNESRGRSSPAVTGSDGMYYFYNVPPDIYYLEVWLYPGRQPLYYKIQVSDPATDIPRIVLP
jgi:hypothetical protein